MLASASGLFGGLIVGVLSYYLAPPALKTLLNQEQEDLYQVAANTKPESLKGTAFKGENTHPYSWGVTMKIYEGFSQMIGCGMIALDPDEMIIKE